MEAIVKPVGKGSDRPAPVMAMLAGFVIWNVSEVVPPTLILVAPKALVKPGSNTMIEELGLSGGPEAGVSVATLMYGSTFGAVP
jgi:hypothetical protein